jgi:predicted transcriptional regulator
MERVADVLLNKLPQFNTTSPNRSIIDAVQQMHCENVDYLIVLDNDQFAGVLTEHGITEKIIYRSRELDTATVREFMNTYLPVATMNDSLEYSMQLMERYNVRHITVFENFIFKGVISSHDLMKEALSKRWAIFDEYTEQHSYPWNY